VPDPLSDAGGSPIAAERRKLGTTSRKTRLSPERMGTSRAKRPSRTFFWFSTECTSLRATRLSSATTKEKDDASLGPGEYAFANECAPKDAPAEGLPGHPDNRTCVVTPRTDAYESNCHRYSRCDGDHTRGRVQKIKASLS